MSEEAICPGCAVNPPHEHRCHGGSCQCLACWEAFEDATTPPPDPFIDGWPEEPVEPWP